MSPVGRPGQAGPDEVFDRVEARMRAEALRSNYEAIRALAPGKLVLPMLKADAYGHGAPWAARQLSDLPALYGYGVATLEEGAGLRSALGARARRARILVFSGTAPWSDEKGAFCEENGLTAVISRDEDWHRFLRDGWPARIPYELKFNTGMNRLGMSPGLARTVARALRHRPAERHPQGVCTHLAIGEEPGDRLSRAQIARFRAIRAELAEAFPSAHFHFANSAALWNAKRWPEGDLSDVVRPGVSLYGVPPWAGAPARGLAAVMTLRALVIEVRKLRAGDALGYGATFRVSAGRGRESSPGSDTPVFAALLAAGYADGLKRSLSNRGLAWLGGAPTRFIGIVSMDLSAVLCSQKTRIGEWAQVLGPQVDAWAQAKAAETIPYELFTSVSTRVRRIYE